MKELLLLMHWLKTYPTEGVLLAKVPWINSAKTIRQTIKSTMLIVCRYFGIVFNSNYIAYKRPTIYNRSCEKIGKNIDGH